MRHKILLTTLRVTMLLATMLLGASAYASDYEKPLENLTAQDVNTIRFKTSATRGETGYNKKLWAQIVKEANDYIDICHNSNDGSFIKHYGLILKRMLPTIRQDTSNIDYRLYSWLYNDNEELDTTTSSPETFTPVNPEDVSSASIKFVIQKTADCDEKAWQKIFDIAHAYTIACNNSKGKEHEDIIDRWGTIVEQLYHLAKAETTIHGILHIEVS